MAEVKSFEGRDIIPSAAKKFGFKKTDCGYFFERSISDGQFTIKVTISNGKLLADVYDVFAEDYYYLHLVEGASGGFVGQVKAEYENLLNEISSTCFKPKFVFGDVGKAVCQYAQKKYSSHLEFLWKDDDKDAILRRGDNKKWYAVFMCIQPKKLGLEGDELLPILDVRAPKEEIANLCDGVNYFKAWHMNKQSWITVVLDGRVNTEVICWLLDMSFDLAATKCRCKYTRKKY
jgi:predicted DNA-binding protein (MmcQ/YjbR family)